MKFKSKHKEVVARQITRQNFVEVIEWVLEDHPHATTNKATVTIWKDVFKINFAYSVIKTERNVVEGDWIVKDSEGGFKVYAETEMRELFKLAKEAAK